MEHNISIYCQETKPNLRLCSLLSGVLFNPISPAFTRAMLKKPTFQKDIHRDTKPIIKIILIVGENANISDKKLLELEAWVIQFAIKYQLKVVIISNKDSLHQRDKNQTRWRDTILNNQNGKFCLVFLGDVTDISKDLDVAIGGYSNLIGCIGVDTPIENVSIFLPSIELQIPVLALSSLSFFGKMNYPHHLSPNIVEIKVSGTHPSLLITLNTKKTIRVWQARSIAMFAEVASLISENSFKTKTGKPLSRL